MKILGVNISHHPSICVYENGKIKSFYNEDRFVLCKGYSLDQAEIMQCILQKVDFKPDMVCYSSYGRNYRYSDTTDEKIIELFQNQLKNPPYFFDQKEHHLYHAVAAFHFSAFKEAVAIIVDGSGSCKFQIPYREIESIYFINNKGINPIYKHSTCFKTDHSLNLKTNTWRTQTFQKGFYNTFSNESRGGIDFLNACEAIGYPGRGMYAGKVMGLSSYAYSKKKYNLDYSKVEIAKNVQEKTFKETCMLIDFAKS